MSMTGPFAVILSTLVGLQRAVFVAGEIVVTR